MGVCNPAHGKQIAKKNFYQIRGRLHLHFGSGEKFHWERYKHRLEKLILQTGGIIFFIHRIISSAFQHHNINLIAACAKWKSFFFACCRFPSRIYTSICSMRTNGIKSAKRANDIDINWATPRFLRISGFSFHPLQFIAINPLG